MVRRAQGQPSADWKEATDALAQMFGLDPATTVRMTFDSMGLVVTSISVIPTGIATDTRYIAARTFTHPVKAVPVEGN